MSGQSHDGFAEMHEHVIAVLFDWHALDAAVKAVRQGSQMIEKKIADFSLIRGDGFDVDQPPR